jgi:hypothetical protein
MDLSICIVNWNTGEYLYKCLASIKTNISESLTYEVIVVDNDSKDNSIDKAREKFKDFIYIITGKNNGFATGSNLAILNSSGRYVLLLNPDTLVYPNVIEAMIKFMDMNQIAGSCGPALLNPVIGKNDISARSFPTLLRLFWNLSYMDRLFPNSPFFSSYLLTYRKYSNDAEEVDWLSGACLLVRRKTIDETCLLDQNFFMYCEDIDWCYAFKTKGWKNYYLPSLRIVHYGGQSSKLKLKDNKIRLSPWAAIQYTKSIIYFYKKNFDFLNCLGLRSILIITSLSKMIGWSILGSVIYGPKIGFGRAYSFYYMFLTSIKKN